MATLRIVLDRETLERLVEVAVRDLRPIELQAMALLRQSLGLPGPYPAHDASREGDRSEEGAGAGAGAPAGA